MKRLIGQPHLIFSVENPRYEVIQKGINHKQALKWLKDLGEYVIDSDGKYGLEEPSIIISNPKHKESILKLARDAGQESVIYSDGKNHKMIYLMVKYQYLNIKLYHTLLNLIFAIYLCLYSSIYYIYYDKYIFHLI